MSITQMSIEDYKGVYELWISTPGMGLNDVDDSYEGIKCFLRRNPTTCFVAKEADKVIGVIMSGHDGRRGYIYHTAVAQSNRKQGIGKALVKHALSALKEEGIHKVALVAFQKNTLGNKFWEAMGFTLREDLNYRNLALVGLKRIDT